jgi:hypothetical protein
MGPTARTSGTHLFGDLGDVLRLLGIADVLLDRIQIAAIEDRLKDAAGLIKRCGELKLGHYLPPVFLGGSG